MRDPQRPGQVHVMADEMDDVCREYSEGPGKNRHIGKVESNWTKFDIFERWREYSDLNNTLDQLDSVINVLEARSDALFAKIDKYMTDKDEDEEEEMEEESEECASGAKKDDSSEGDDKTNSESVSEQNKKGKS